jgi:hypothetical protein
MKHIVVACLAIFAVACGRITDSTQAHGDISGTPQALSGLSAGGKAKYNYSCWSFYWNGDDQQRGTMTLTVSGNSAKADIIEENWDNLGGNIDRKYRPRGKMKFLKFGHNLILEESLVSGGHKLRDGSLGGIARVEGEGEGGFYQYKFICKRR